MNAYRPSRVDCVSPWGIRASCPVAGTSPVKSKLKDRAVSKNLSSGAIPIAAIVLAATRMLRAATIAREGAPATMMACRLKGRFDFVE